MQMSANIRQQKCAIFMHICDLCTKRAGWCIQNEKKFLKHCKKKIMPEWIRAMEKRWTDLTKPCDSTFLEILLYTLERHKCYDGSSEMIWLNRIGSRNRHKCPIKMETTTIAYISSSLLLLLQWYLTSDWRRRSMPFQLIFVINLKQKPGWWNPRERT